MSKSRQLSVMPNTTFGMRNRIINGDFRIDQRNAGASQSPSGNTFIVDRFALAQDAASKFTCQQNAGSVTPPAGFKNYAGVTSTSAYSPTSGQVFGIYQNIEGLNIADLGWGTANAQTVTVSFWVRSSLTGTFGGAFQNAAGNRSYPFTYSISSANTWEYKTVTVAGDTTGTWATDNSTGISLFFSLGAGSGRSSTAGAWAAGQYNSATGATSVVGTNGATFYITGVQLEKGSTATSFDYRPYGTELALCQRYYQRGFAKIGGGVYNSNYARLSTSFKSTMRATPTISLSANCSLDFAGVRLETLGLAATNAGTDSFHLTFGPTANAYSTGQVVTNDSNNNILADAEL